MMVRRFNIQFTNSAGMMLPGFRPEIGDIFGQGHSSFGLSPGIGFAFGDVRRSYIDEAYEKGWLITDTEKRRKCSYHDQYKELEYTGKS